jgi:hypothetical protein
MIVTKQQLQQLIDEEFSRAIEKRKRSSLQERTAHKVGDTVRSTVDAQGMKKGQEYKVVDVEHGKWGTVMYGIQPATGGEQLWIGNGHLLLEPVASDVSEADGMPPELDERHRGRVGVSSDLYELTGLDLVDFARTVMNLGDAVVEQLADILSGSYDDINPNALDMIEEELGGVNSDIDEAIQAAREHLEQGGEDEDDGSWAYAAKVNR